MIMMNRKLAMFSTSILAAAMLLACTPKKEAKPTEGAAAAGSTAPTAEKRKLVIGTDASYAPFESTNPAGEIVGFDIDIAKEMCAEIKAECKFVNQDFDGIIAGLTAKKYDMIVSSLSITAERKLAVRFTDKVWDAPIRFAAKVGSTLQTTPEGLKGKTIGVQMGTIQETYIKKYYPDSKVKSYKTVEGVYNDLAAKRTDVIFVDGVTLSEGFLNTPAGKDFAQLGEDVPASADTAILGEGMGFAVRKEDEALANDLNKALDTIRKNGKYKEINDKYFKFDIYGASK
jgi:histidine transport system substrate-binding protein